MRLLRYIYVIQTRNIGVYFFFLWLLLFIEVINWKKRCTLYSFGSTFIIFQDNNLSCLMERYKIRTVVMRKNYEATLWKKISNVDMILLEEYDILITSSTNINSILQSKVVEKVEMKIYNVQCARNLFLFKVSSHSKDKN